MRPVLFQLGDAGIPSYWILLMIGFMAAIYFSWYEARRDHLDAIRLLDLCLILMLSGLVGARLMHVLVEEDPLRPGTPILYHYLSHPVDILKMWNGLAFYGGLLLSIPVAYWFTRKAKLDFLKTTDVLGVGIPLGLFFGRLGCFLAGCCFGKPTQLPWGITFEDPHALARPLNVALHPTQLYSALLALFLFGFLWVLKRRLKRFDGQVFLTFLMLYSAGRFLIEFLRNDNRGMFFGGLLSSSQVVALVLLAVSAVGLVVLNRRKKTQPKTTPVET